MAAVTSAVVAGVGATMSFVQAHQANQRKKEADRRATEALAEAREKLSFNAYEGLGINKEAFELQRESLNQAVANAMEGVREGTRQGQEGKILAQAQRQHREIASDMTDEKNMLDRLVADQDQANNQELVEIDKAVTEGAQIASENAEYQRNMSIMQGVGGLAKAVGLGIDAMPLYRKTAEARRISKLGKDATSVRNKLSNYNKEGVDLSATKDMDIEALRTFIMDNYTPDEVKTIMGAPTDTTPQQRSLSQGNNIVDPLTWGQNGNFNLGPTAPNF